MSYLRTFVVSYKQYQVWIVRYDGRKHEFLRKKRVAQSNDDDPIQSDHPADVMRQKLYKPPRHVVDALLEKLNPLEQYQNIKILADPKIFQARKVKKDTQNVWLMTLSIVNGVGNGDQ